MPVFRSTLPLSPREAARSRNRAVFFCGRYVGRIWAQNAKTSLKAGSTQSNPFCPKRKNRKGSFLLCRIISLCLTRNRHSVHIYDGIKANPNSSNKANPIPATKPPDRVALLVEQAVHIDDVYPLRTCTPERAKKKQALDLQGLASGGDSWTRTNDPIDVNDVLYRLSHATLLGHPPILIILPVRTPELVGSSNCPATVHAPPKP